MEPTGYWGEEGIQDSPLRRADSDSDPPDLPITETAVPKGAATFLGYLLCSKTEMEALTA